jgi:hypothetical protein
MTEPTEKVNPATAPRRTRLIPASSELPLLVREHRAFAGRYRWPLLFLAIAATADAVTTMRNLQLYGPSVEVHPAHRIIYELFTPEIGAPLAKLMQLGFVLFVAAWWKPWCRALLWLCAAMYAFAALSNHFQWL